MAVAYVDSAISHANATTNTITGLAVTGSNRCVTAAGYVLFDRALTSITAAGNAMTDSGLGSIDPGTGFFTARYLTESGLSASTSQNIVATYGGVASHNDLVAFAHSGVADAAPESVESQTNTAATTLADSDATVTTGALCVAFAGKRNDSTITATGDFTEREELNTAVTMSAWGGDYVGVTAPDTANYSLSWAGNTESAGIIMIFAAAGAAGAVVPATFMYYSRLRH